MADPFSIIGVIGVAAQIIQIGVQFGLDWKDAPADAKSFVAELQALKTVLYETQTNIIANQDFADAFHGRHSALLSQLGPLAHDTDTAVMVSACEAELQGLLADLKKRAQGHRVGWERLKGALLAKKTREAVENLHRQCQILNRLIGIDALALSANIYKEVQAARKEQQDWHMASDHKAILDWLTPIDYAAQQSDFINRRQAETGQWLLNSEKFKAWMETDNQTLFCPGIPGAGKTILAAIIIEKLTACVENDKSIGVAYLYCNFRRYEEQRAEDLLASLLKQLVQDRPSLLSNVRNLYDSYKDKPTRPPLYELSRTSSP